MNPLAGAGSNPPAGGSSANPSVANPPGGGLPNLNPAQSGTPAGGTGSNPPAGGSGTHQATPPEDGTQDNAPIPADVYREKARSEAALRRQNAELRQQLQARDDEKLSEADRDKKRIQELERERVQHQQERKQFRLARVVDGKARELNLVDTNAATTLFMAEYGDQIDWDEDGTPLNADVLFTECVRKYPFLIAPASPQPQAPPTGRPASPPRTPPGARPPAAQLSQPRPLTAADALGNIDWAELDRGRNQGG